MLVLVQDDLILFGKPYPLADERAWQAHTAQLDGDYGAGCHHGEPESFPCLVLSRSTARPSGQVRYFHDFVTLEDACLLIDAARGLGQTEEPPLPGAPLSLEARRGLYRRAFAALRGAVVGLEEPDA
jgi:hypothetical protein